MISKLSLSKALESSFGIENKSDKQLSYHERGQQGSHQYIVCTLVGRVQYSLCFEISKRAATISWNRESQQLRKQINTVRILCGEALAYVH